MAAAESSTWQSAALRLGLALGLAGVIAYRGVRKRSLSIDGGLAALIVGTVTMFAGLRFGLTLLTFFYSSSALTKYRGDVKRKLDAEYKEGGQRDAVQVLCNGLWGTLAAAAYVWSIGASQPLLDARLHPLVTLLCGAFIGHYAACAGDTWASELGVLAQRDPILVVGLRRVPRGTNGAVSPLGCLATVLGGASVGAAFAFASLPAPASYVATVVALGAACGAFGSLVDSVLGATLQYSGFCLTCKKAVNRPRHTPAHRLSHVAGTDLLSNNTVNFVAAFAGAALGAWLAMRLF